MHSSDIAHIERATITAVSPQAVEELPGWLLPFNIGTVGRAISAVPLSHDVQHDVASLVAQIEARYLAHGFKAAFRLPDVANFAPLREHLTKLGYRMEQPTFVQIGRVLAMRQLADQPLADVDDVPDAAWAQLFLGEGFDPVDGAHRVALLSRAPGTAFASLRHNGETVAGGAGSFSHGWASVHGMRTVLSHRGQGLAKQVLASLAQTALDRGFENVFLQVEADNASANALYKKAGFVTAWQYAYWRK
jgi:N-acetylglutamate synthase